MKLAIFPSQEDKTNFWTLLIGNYPHTKIEYPEVLKSTLDLVWDKYPRDFVKINLTKIIMENKSLPNAAKIKEAFEEIYKKENPVINPGLPYFPSGEVLIPHSEESKKFVEEQMDVMRKEWMGYKTTKRTSPDVL